MNKCYNKANGRYCYFCCWNSLNNFFYRIVKNISNYIVYNGTKTNTE